MIKLFDILNEDLDPIGQEDTDINNDGKVDKTDKYLSKRRKAVAANIKEDDKSRQFKLKIINKNGTSTTQTVSANPSTNELFNIVSNLKKSKNIADVKILDNMDETHLNWPPTPDHEATMAMGELRSMIKNSITIYKNVKPNQQLPGWVSAYVTLASDYMNSVAQYLVEEEATLGQETNNG